MYLATAGLEAAAGGWGALEAALPNLRVTLVESPGGWVVHVAASYCGRQPLWLGGCWRCPCCGMHAHGAAAHKTGAAASKSKSGHGWGAHCTGREAFRSLPALLLERYCGPRGVAVNLQVSPTIFLHCMHGHMACKHAPIHYSYPSCRKEIAALRAVQGAAAGGGARAGALRAAVTGAAGRRRGPLPHLPLPQAARAARCGCY